jgi:hypothetical protein
MSGPQHFRIPQEQLIYVNISPATCEKEEATTAAIKATSKTYLKNEDTKKHRITNPKHQSYAPTFKIHHSVFQ